MQGNGVGIVCAAVGLIRFSVFVFHVDYRVKKIFLNMDDNDCLMMLYLFRFLSMLAIIGVQIKSDINQGGFGT